MESKPKQLKATSKECTMCGDVGFPSELFACTGCLRRYQHKYCSDLYPKSLSPRVCNWCLHLNPSNSNSNSETTRGVVSGKRKARSASPEGAKPIGREVPNLSPIAKPPANKKVSFSHQQCNREKLQFSHQTRGIAKRYKLLSQVSC